MDSTGWIFVAVGATLVGWAGYVVARGWRSRRWPAAAGHVVTFASSERRGKGGRPVYRFEVRYRYTVGGATYEGGRIGFGVQQVTPPGRAAAGMPVTVYYNPREPGEAVLKRDAPAFETVCGLLGLALIAAGLARLT